MSGFTQLLRFGFVSSSRRQTSGKENFCVSGLRVIVESQIFQLNLLLLHLRANKSEACVHVLN